MSIRAWSLVWERTRAKGSNLLMLLAIADYAKDDGRWAWPSARTLSWKTRLTGRGGELVLWKLVADREVWPEWDAAEGRLYLQLRCVMDWEAYQTEGPPPEREKISRSQSEKFSLRLVALACAKAKTAAPKAKSAARNAKTADPSLLSDPKDPSGSEEQGLRPDHPPVHAVENSQDDEPDRHLFVVTKLAHDVLARYALTPDITERDVVDGIELLCSREVYNIATTRDLVSRAIASAVYQRRRAGKSPVLNGSPGDAAFRMQALKAGTG